ncbi:MAG: putative Ig domain-containing protein, partial [Chloroflexi bacterium]|nr:putative Ig domain-containing protein [Chloroflexota bacterium]
MISGWNSSAVTVNFACADAGTGIEFCTDPFTVTSEGDSNLAGITMDKAGNSAGTSVAVKIDRTPPTVSATYAPPANAAGWNSSAVTVTFECADSRSGVASCSDPFTVTSEGFSNLLGGAFDNAGNSTNKAFAVNVDRTAPTITATGTPPANAAGWNSSAVTVNFACADAGSGIASCTDPFTVTTEGDTNLAGGAFDNAGNSKNISYAVKVDRTAPAVMPPSPVNATSYSAAGVAVTYGTASAADGGSGLDGAVTCAPATGSVFPVGATQVTCSAKDLAGNTGNSVFAVNVTLVAAPTVTGVSPAHGAPAGGTSVTVAGTDFTGATAVTFGAAAAASFTVNSATQITAVSPAGAGTAHIAVTTPAGASAASAADQFTYNVAPVITSTASATFAVGTVGSFAVTATGFPAPALSLAGTLPSGVSFTPATGALSGTPAAGSGGNFALTLTASNGIDANATQSFTLTVNQAPAITSGVSVAFTAGAEGSFSVTATGFPAPTFSHTGALPSGVTLNAATGALSGTPAMGSAGTYPITITASNGVGTAATQSFTLTVGVGNSAPAITSASSTTFAVGAAGSFAVTAAGFPAPTFGHIGTLPNGVTLTAAGILSGVPAAATGGLYTVTLKAGNGVGTDATQAFTLTVNQSPAITSAAAAMFTLGFAGSFTVTATGFPAPTYGSNLALPSGLSLNSTTGVLNGTPAAGTSGSYPVTITASNGVAPAATQSLTLTITGAARLAVTGVAPASPVQGTPFSVT